MKQTKDSMVDKILEYPFGHYLVKVPMPFIKNHINDADIVSKIQHHSKASENLLSPPKIISTGKLENETLHLYGLIHAKYIETEDGLKAMFEKYTRNSYPICPRTLCHKCACLPCGIGQQIKMYCPNCEDCYDIVEGGMRVDSSWFGYTYIKKLIQKYPDIVRSPKAEAFEPRVFGFRVRP